MQEPHSDLLALIRNSVNPVDKRLTVISIVGSGGMGKSCLAAKVFHHEEVMGRFPMRAFSFTTGKNKENVLLDILQKIHGALLPTDQNPHGHSIDTVLDGEIPRLIGEIRKHLAGRTREEKRYEYAYGFFYLADYFSSRMK